MTSRQSRDAELRLIGELQIMAHENGARHSVHSATLADVLERVLDKGLVIAGDIKVKLVDIELLTIQIRLVICSVDKAREMGMDWWVRNPDFASLGAAPPRQESIDDMRNRIASLEGKLASLSPSPIGETRL